MMFHGVYNLEVRKRLERKGVKVTSIGIVCELNKIHDSHLSC